MYVPTWAEQKDVEEFTWLLKTQTISEVNKDNTYILKINDTKHLNMHRIDFFLKWVCAVTISGSTQSLYQNKSINTGVYKYSVAGRNGAFKL